MLAVVVADVEVEGDFQFERQKAGTSTSHLRGLAAWLVAQEVEEVVMESTRSTGGWCGKRWNNTGGHSAARAPVHGACRAHFTSRKRNRIVAPVVARTFRMRNGW